MDFNDDDENRVLLLVHDTKPPFLAGQVLSGKATGVVLPLKDPTSDMAVIARWAGLRCMWLAGRGAAVLLWLCVLVVFLTSDQNPPNVAVVCRVHWLAVLQPAC